MITLKTLSQLSHPKRPSAITIGSMDGVHLGHQHLLKKMRQLVGPEGSVCVVTFSNHPSHVLPHAEPVELIGTIESKLKWLEQFGADIVYCFPFSPEIADIDYESFLRNLMRICPFDHLVQGEEDAHLGKNREGTPEKIRELCKLLNAKTHFLPKLTLHSEVVSSRKIRRLLKEGKREEAIALLGHPIG